MHPVDQAEIHGHNVWDWVLHATASYLRVSHRLCELNCLTKWLHKLFTMPYDARDHGGCYKAAHFFLFCLKPVFPDCLRCHQGGWSGCFFSNLSLQIDFMCEISPLMVVLLMHIYTWSTGLVHSLDAHWFRILVLRLGKCWWGGAGFIIFIWFSSPTHVFFFFFCLFVSWYLRHAFSYSKLARSWLIAQQLNFAHGTYTGFRALLNRRKFLTF